MVLDRQYQNELLNFLLQDYPEYEHAHEHCKKLYINDCPKYIGNVDYLQQHGLLRDGVLLSHGVDGTTSVGVIPFPKITEKGIDFVAQDGGLSAILNVQTVKIHPDTIKALVEARLLSSSLDPQQKNFLGRSTEEASRRVRQTPTRQTFGYGNPGNAVFCIWSFWTSVNIRMS